MTAPDTENMDSTCSKSFMGEKKKMVASSRKQSGAFVGQLPAPHQTGSAGLACLSGLRQG